jgi:SAM-dependent methyltransferase
VRYQYVVAGGDRDRWNARYRAGEEYLQAESWVIALDVLLPRRGRALDIAGGSGRHALWLARRGLDVTVADLSDVALDRAARQARDEELALTTVQVDLEAAPLPSGPWDLVLCLYYLHRSIFPSLAAALAPGGLLVVAHATRTNLERHAHPGRRWLLEDGELPTLVRGLEVLRYEEGWLDSGRHEARLVARRPA